MFDMLNKVDVVAVTDLTDYVPHDMDMSYLGKEHTFQLTQIRQLTANNGTSGAKQ